MIATKNKKQSAFGQNATQFLRLSDLPAFGYFDA